MKVFIITQDTDGTLNSYQDDSATFSTSLPITSGESLQSTLAQLGDSIYNLK